MVLDKIDDSMDALLDRLKDLSQRAILPEEVVALITSIVLDKMSYSNEIDELALKRYAEATSPDEARMLKEDLIRLPQGQIMMICPGGDHRCGTDIIRSLAISDMVPEPFRSQMESAMETWIETMDDIARAASQKIGVPVTVRYDLTKTGPALAFGWGREHGHDGDHGHAAASAAPVPESK